jgi:spoIIIJ-associated protein
MRSVESEGDTIDEAIGKALGILRVERDRVEVEILEDAKRGLLGFGGRPARVRATVRPPLAGSTVTAGEVPRGTPAVPTPVAATSVSGSESVAAGDRPREVLEQILHHLSLACTVTVHPVDEDGSMRLALEGGESGLIIGRRGETLDALEYLVNRIAFRDDGSAAHRIVLDVEGYRERRRSSLEEMARRMAEKATEGARIVALNPMSPRDRRIIHLTLQGVEGISTRSQGTGYYRRVLVVPANATRGPRPRRPER